MPPPVLSAADIALIAFYALVVVAPGLLVGLAAGLRGWVALTSAPLLTYAVAGLAGPWTTALGIGWTPIVFAASVGVFAVLLAGVRFGVARAAGIPWWAERFRPAIGLADVGAAVSVLVAAVLGAVVILTGMRRLDTIPQDWDAVFHANGIRWISDTGDAGLFGMSQVNWYEIGGIFYPNAYHLVASVVHQFVGRSIPEVLNAHTALIPGLCALVLAAVVRRFGGSPVHVGATAIAAVLVSPLYDMLWRGPLLPYTTGVALTPVIVVLLAEALDHRGVAARTRGVLVLALAAAGLVCLHPAMGFGAVVLAVPLLAWRWVRQPRSLRLEPLLLVGAGLLAGALAFAQLSGSLRSAAEFPPADWPAEYETWEAVVQLLTYGHPFGEAQWWLTALAAIGLVTYARLGELRWIALPAAVFGTLFVLAATSDADWVNAITRPWWNDQWRLAGLFALTLCVLIGFGADRCWRGLTALVRRYGGRVGPRSAAAGALALVVAVSVVATGGGYFDRNATRMSFNTDGDHGVSEREIAGLLALAEVASPDVRVMNDRGDGSVWMYALTGLRPVAGHYDATGLGDTDVGLLEGAFNQLGTDPEVRAAIERLDVEFVWLGEGFLRAGAQRVPGLVGLDDLPYLEPVYSNPEVRLFQVRTGLDVEDP